MVYTTKIVKNLGRKTRAAVANSAVSRKTLVWGVITLAKKLSADAGGPTVTTSPQRSREQKWSLNPSTTSCKFWKPVRTQKKELKRKGSNSPC